jgi:hypothetical protein
VDDFSSLKNHWAEAEGGDFKLPPKKTKTPVYIMYGDMPPRTDISLYDERFDRLIANAGWVCRSNTVWKKKKIKIGR